MFVRVREIALENFRVFPKLQLAVSGDLVFFTGANGSGKTSLLEAVAVCSMVRSFRTVSDSDLITWDQNYYSVDVIFHDGQQELRLHAAYGRHDTTQNNQRRLLINKEKVSRLAAFIGRLPTVIFSPDDLEIIDSGPGERRRFLDILLSSLYPAYFEALQQYNRVLKQRSLLLRRGVNDASYFAALDCELALHGSLIQEKRQQFVTNYQAPFERYVQQISHSRDAWQLSYRPSIVDGGDRHSYAAALAKNLPHDLKVKMTLRGIHRDRLVFHPPQRPNLELQQIASQGQKRTVALALKMAQYAYVKEQTGKLPVLLVDDVLNELDINRRQAFIGFLHEIGQAIFTTTDVAEMEGFIKERRAHSRVEVFRVEKNSVGHAEVHAL